MSTAQYEIGNSGSSDLKQRIRDFSSAIAVQMQSAPGVQGVRVVYCPGESVPVVRVLFAFERDVHAIHRHITSLWKLRGLPRALISTGDPLGMRATAQSLGMEIAEPADASLTSIEYDIESDLFVVALRTTIRLVNAFEDIWEQVQAESVRVMGDAADLSAQMLRRLIEDGSYAFHLLYGSKNRTASASKQDPITATATIAVDVMKPVSAEPVAGKKSEALFEVSANAATAKPARPDEMSTSEFGTPNAKPGISVTVNPDPKNKAKTVATDLSATVSIPRPPELDAKRGQKN